MQAGAEGGDRFEEREVPGLERPTHVRLRLTLHIDLIAGLMFFVDRTDPAPSGFRNHQGRSMKLWCEDGPLCAAMFPPTRALHGNACGLKRRTAPLLDFVQMFQKCAVYAAAEVMSQLQNSHATVSILITQWNESATLPFFDRHFRHYGHSTAGRYHRQNRGELAALKNDVGLESRPGTHREGILAKAVALLEQQKRVILDLYQVHVRERCQTMVTGNDQVQPFTKEFVTQAMSSRNWQGKQRQVDRALVDECEKFVGDFFYHANLHATVERARGSLHCAQETLNLRSSIWSRVKL